MKLLPLFFLNVATVALGLVAYDQLRDKGTSDAQGDGSLAKMAALERRIHTLESERLPRLRGVETDPRVWERLDAIEERLHAAVVPATRLPPAEDGAQEAEPVHEEEPSPLASSGQPTAEDVAAFRRLQEAAKREERMMKMEARVNKALEQVGLNLTPRQREKILAARADFEPRINEIWGEVKTQAMETIAAGGQVNRLELGAQASAQIQQEFAQTITGVVSSPDAEVISAALLPGRK